MSEPAIVTVYAVFADAQEACRIGAVAVAERLCACVNVLGPCQSIYRWEGEVKVAAETPALFKTRADRAEALIARIAELHGYDLPAAVAWPIGAALPAYAAWVAAESGG